MDLQQKLDYVMMILSLIVMATHLGMMNLIGSILCGYLMVDYRSIKVHLLLHV
jgi:hypothetical protein